MSHFVNQVVHYQARSAEGDYVICMFGHVYVDIVLLLWSPAHVLLWRSYVLIHSPTGYVVFVRVGVFVSF